MESSYVFILFCTTMLNKTSKLNGISLKIYINGETVSEFVTEAVFSPLKPEKQI